MNDSIARIHYVIELKTVGLNTKLILNDVEIARGKVADRKIIQQKVNGWMVKGSNSLVLWAALEDPAHPPPLVDLKCLIFRGPQGRQPEESEALDRFSERDKTKLPASSMQQVWSASFHADPCYGPWRWEIGRPIVLNDTSTAAVVRVMRSVVNALNRNDRQELLASFRVMTEENVRAYGFEASQIEAQLRDCVAPGRRLQPGLRFWPTTRWRLRAVAACCASNAKTESRCSQPTRGGVARGRGTSVWPGWMRDGSLSVRVGTS